MISSATPEIRRLVLAVALGIAAAGCGGGRTEAPRAAVDAAPADTAVTPPGTTPNVPAGEIPAAGEIEEKSAAAATLREPILRSGHLIPGYRIQIFTSSWLDDAERLRDRLRGEGIAAYVEYRSPLYRVRIGDCTDLAEARELMERAVLLGYDRAAIVPTLVQAPEKPAAADGTP